MTTDDVSSGERGVRRGSARDRILEAAADLFYREGIRATSADRIIDEVGITKVTFYRHFRTKSDLIVRYIERQALLEQAWMASLKEGADVRATLTSLADGIAAAGRTSSFRGCAFLNAAAEYPDADDPVRVAVDSHRRWMQAYFADLAATAGVSDPAGVADQLLMLRDGAMMSGYLRTPDRSVASAGSGFVSILDAALVERG